MTTVTDLPILITNGLTLTRDLPWLAVSVFILIVQESDVRLILAHDPGSRFRS